MPNKTLVILNQLLFGLYYKKVELKRCVFKPLGLGVQLNL
jgi:hypothetical protein